jgi:hypothetical protein
LYQACELTIARADIEHRLGRRGDAIKLTGENQAFQFWVETNEVQVGKAVSPARAIRSKRDAAEK